MNMDYPDETEGSRLARESRTKANKLSHQERRRLFKRGMELIYTPPASAPQPR